VGFPGLKNIPQVPGNGVEVGQNHDARKRYRPLFQSLSEVGLDFGPETRK